MEFFSIETKEELIATSPLVRGNSGPKPNGSWGCNSPKVETKLGKALKKLFK